MSSVLRFDEWQDSDGNPVASGVGGFSAPGSILQVVSTTKTDTFSASIASGGFSSNVPGLEATITPTSTSSKILISVIAHGARTTDFPIFNFRVVRNGTAVGVATSTGSRAALSGSSLVVAASGPSIASASSQFLDSPSTISALTYGIQLAPLSGITETMFVNRTDDDANNAFRPRAVSTITVMEVAG